MSDANIKVTAKRKFRIFNPTSLDGIVQTWNVDLNGLLSGELRTDSALANPKPRAEFDATAQIVASDGHRTHNLEVTDVRENGDGSFIDRQNLLRSEILEPGKEYEVVVSLRTQAFVPGRQALSHKSAQADFFRRRSRTSALGLCNSER